MRNKKTILVTIAMNLPSRKKDERSGVDYVGACLKMVESYLEYSPMDIYVATNEVDRFNDLKNRFRGRLRVGYYPTSLARQEELGSMNESLKFNALRDVIDDPYEVYYLCDGDLLCSGWCEESWQEMVNDESVDVWTSTPLCSPHLISYTHSNQHLGFLTYSHREERVVYTNKKQLEEMLMLWEDVDLWKLYFSTPIEWWRAMGGTIGVMMGVASKLVGANVKMVKINQYNFTNYEWVVRREDGVILNRWWVDEAMIDVARWKREGLEEKIRLAREGHYVVEGERCPKWQAKEDERRRKLLQEKEEAKKRRLEEEEQARAFLNSSIKELVEEGTPLMGQVEEPREYKDLLKEKEDYEKFKEDLRLEQELEEARAKIVESIPNQDRVKPIKEVCNNDEELENALVRIFNKHSQLQPLMNGIKLTQEVVGKRLMKEQLLRREDS